MKLVPWNQVKDILNVAEGILESVEDELTVRYTHVAQPYTQEHLRAFLATPPAGVKRWAIVVDDRYAGNVELRHRSGHVADLGYTAAPWARGRGITSDAVRRVTQWAHESGIHRSNCAPRFTTMLRAGSQNAPDSPLKESAGMESCCAASTTTSPCTRTCPRTRRTGLTRMSEPGHSARL